MRVRLRFRVRRCRKIRTYSSSNNSSSIRSRSSRMGRRRQWVRRLLGRRSKPAPWARLRRGLPAPWARRPHEASYRTLMQVRKSVADAVSVAGHDSRSTELE